MTSIFTFLNLSSMEKLEGCSKRGAPSTHRLGFSIQQSHYKFSAIFRAAQTSCSNFFHCKLGRTLMRWTGINSCHKQTTWIDKSQSSLSQSLSTIKGTKNTEKYLMRFLNEKFWKLLSQYFIIIITPKE